MPRNFSQSEAIRNHIVISMILFYAYLIILSIKNCRESLNPKKKHFFFKGNSSVRQELGNSSYPECLRNSRCWLNTPFGQNYRQKTDDFAFSVMSYNVLAQSLLRSNSYLYSHCHPDALNWHKRSQTLFTEISYFRPDVSTLFC